MRKETESWWRQARADLETARLTLGAGRYYAASWFAQQAVEKGLKAFYLEQRGTLAPRTHDLEYLGTLAGVTRTVVADLAFLNPAFDLVRYPEPTSGRAPVDMVTSALATDHLAAEERVLQWLDRQLNPASTPP